MRLYSDIPVTYVYIQEQEEKMAVVTVSCNRRYATVNEVLSSVENLEVHTQQCFKKLPSVVCYQKLVNNVFLPCT